MSVQTAVRVEPQANVAELAYVYALARHASHSREVAADLVRLTRAHPELLANGGNTALERANRVVLQLAHRAGSNTGYPNLGNALTPIGRMRMVHFVVTSLFLAARIMGLMVVLFTVPSAREAALAGAHAVLDFVPSFIAVLFQAEGLIVPAVVMVLLGFDLLLTWLYGKKPFVALWRTRKILAATAGEQHQRWESVDAGESLAGFIGRCKPPKSVVSRPVWLQGMVVAWWFQGYRLTDILELTESCTKRMEEDRRPAHEIFSRFAGTAIVRGKEPSRWLARRRIAAHFAAWTVLATAVSLSVTWWAQGLAADLGRGWPIGANTLALWIMWGSLAWRPFWFLFPPVLRKPVGSLLGLPSN